MAHVFVALFPLCPRGDASATNKASAGAYSRNELARTKLSGKSILKKINSLSKHGKWMCANCLFGLMGLGFCDLEVLHS